MEYLKIICLQRFCCYACMTVLAIQVLATVVQNIFKVWRNYVSKPSVFKLRCAYQTFEWGKLGTSSLVAELLKNSDEKLKIDPETPYSELWMGTHCLGASRIVKGDGTEEDLRDWITNNPTAVRLGEGDERTNELPFMFKVLSIRKTLSLQVHPDKSMAKKLHEQFPDVYKDGNHKPEMGIAINNFRALNGFKPIQLLAQHLSDIEELRGIVGTANANNLISVAETSDKTKHQEALKLCFEETFVRYSKYKYTLLGQLISRVQKLAETGNDIKKYEGSNLLKIAGEYPGDMGALAVYFLNEIVLQPGQALFTPSNEPHAYIEGDCLECLPCSHNIVRFGLTHKLKDSPQLVKMLQYESKQPEDILVDEESNDDNGCDLIHYLPPTEDFAVTRIEVAKNVQEATLNSLQTASIVLCMEGQGRVNNTTLSSDITIGRGTAVFVSAGETIGVHKDSESLVLYRAYAPI